MYLLSGLSIRGERGGEFMLLSSEGRNQLLLLSHAIIYQLWFLTAIPNSLVSGRLLASTVMLYWQ